MSLKLVNKGPIVNRSVLVQVMTWRRTRHYLKPVMYPVRFTMMTTWHGMYAFRITGPLWGESSGNRWIPHARGQWCGVLMFLLVSTWKKTVEQTIERQMNWDGLTLIWRHSNALRCVTKLRCVLRGSMQFVTGLSDRNKICQNHFATTWWRHQMETFPRYWPFVRGIHRSPVNSPHKGQWRGALMFSVICA